MAVSLITAADLDPFGLPDDAKTAAMIADAQAQAVIAAPCLTADDLDEGKAAAALAILRAAIVRWHEAGSRAKVTTQRTAGVFSESETLDNTRNHKGAFWPSEITALQDLCRNKPAPTGKPYTIEMVGAQPVAHRAWCDVMFGGLSCSCGASIAGHPIYEA